MAHADRKRELDGIARPGFLIGDSYRVEHVIGHGGMGAVVAAVHQKLGQRVAIKILYPSAAKNREAVARFLREAQSAAALQSEHVVRILDFGALKSGAPYMVMEHLVGMNLAQALQARGPLPVDEAVGYVLQSCEAVAEAHARGIVHRDIKPANLFLTRRPDGSPLIKVLDFGISKAAWPGATDDYNPDLTQTTDTLGTPMYMSPEQVRSTKTVSPRTDIWALGVVLYELLAGVAPFWAESLPALSAKIVADPAAPLSNHRSDLPEGLESVVMWCLEKSTKGRPTSVADLARALAPFGSDAARASAERIDRVVQGALQMMQTDEGNALASSPPLRSDDANHAWGTTHHLRRNLRGGLISLAAGGLAALAAAAIWWVVAAPRAPGPAIHAAATGASTPGPSASSAHVDAPLVDAAQADAGNDGTTPGTVSSADAASTTKPPATRTGAPRSDPLGDRY